MSGEPLFKAQWLPRYQFSKMVNNWWIYEDYQFHKHFCIIFTFHQLLTILENWYIGSYWALNNGSPFIFYLIDIEKICLDFYFHFLNLLPKLLTRFWKLVSWECLYFKSKGCFRKNLTIAFWGLAWQIFTKIVENGNKNADIFFLCPWGKKWMANHFFKAQ